MGKFKLYLLKFSVVLLTLNCGTEKDLRVIDDFGKYSVSGGMTLHVSNKEGLLDYQLINSQGELLLETFTPVSIYHRWGMCIDDDQTLWVFTSDRGNYKWEKNSETGSYEATWLDRNDLVPEEILKTELKRFVSR